MIGPKRRDSSRSGSHPGSAALLVAIVATAAFAVIPAPYGWDVYAIRFAGMLIAATLWVLAATLGGLRAPELDDRRNLGALLALAVAVVLATALGYAPVEMLSFGNGYYGGAVTWLAWLLLVALASLARPSDRMRRGLLVAQLPVAVLSIAAIYDEVIPSSYVGVFENSNHLVPGLIVAVPISLGLAHASKDRGWRVASLVSAALAAVAVAVSRSSTGMLGLLLVLVLAATLAPELLGVTEPRRRRHLRTAAVVCMSVLLAVVVAVSAAPKAARSVGLGSLRDELFGSSFSARLFYWNAAVSTAASRPLLGVGADGFEVAAQRLVDTSEGSQEILQGARDWAPIAGDAHNLFLTVLVSFGIVGLVCAGAIAVSWAVSVRSMWQRGTWSGLRAAFTIAAISWFVAMLLLPLSVQWGGYVAMMFGLALARSPKGDQVEVPNGVRTAVRYLGYAAVAGLVLLAASVLVGNYWFWTADSASGNDEYFARMSKAEAAQPTMAHYRFVRLDSQGQTLSGSDEDLASYHKAVDGSGPAIREDVRYMTVLVRTSLDEAYVTGRTDLSWEENHLARLSSLAPALPELVMEQAHLALLKGNAASALELLLEVKPYQATLPRTALYRLYYAQLTGNSDAAQQMRKIVTQQGVPARLFAR